MLPADVGADCVLYKRVFLRAIRACQMQAQKAGVYLVGELVVKGVCGQPQGGFCNVDQSQLSSLPVGRAPSGFLLGQRDEAVLVDYLAVDKRQRDGHFIVGLVVGVVAEGHAKVFVP